MQEQDKLALLAEILPAPSNIIANHTDASQSAGCTGLCESPGGCKGINPVA